LRINKKFLLGALGIAISVALFSSIIAITDSLQYGLVKALMDDEWGVDAVVLPEEDGIALEPVAHEPLDWSYSLRRVKRAENLDAIIIELDLERERKMGIGIAKDLDVGEKGCAISTALSEDRGLDIGDSIWVNGKKYWIDGLVKENTRIIYLNSVMTYGDIALIKFADRDEFYSRSVDEIIEASKEMGSKISAIYWASGEVLVVLPIAQGLKALSIGMSYLTATFLIVAIIALIVASILIFSLISIRAEEREREFAIYRAIGKRKNGIFFMVLKESLAISATGAVLGALLGLGLSALLASALSMPVQVNGLSLILPISVGVIMGIVSGLYPAYSSAKKEISQSIDPHRRGYKRGKVVMERGMSGLLVGIGFLVSFLSLFTLFVMPVLSVRGGEESMLAIVMILMTSMIVGLALIGVGGVAPLIEKGLSRLTKAISSGVGTTAETYVKRHRRRNATTSVMFSIAICFTVFISSIYAMQDRSFGVTIPYENGADCVVSSPEGLPDDFVDDLRSMGGVKSISLVTVGKECLISDEILFEQPINCVLYGVDENLADTIYPEFRGAKVSLPEEQWQVTIPRSIASSLGIDLWNKVNLMVGDERKELYVVGIASALPGFPSVKENENLAPGGAVLCSPGLIGEDIGRVLINFEPGMEGQTVKQIREKMSFYPYEPISLTVTSEEVKGAKEASSILLAGLFAILILSVLIAFFGLVTSSYVSIRESGFEIGVLRSLGIRKSAISAIFTVEATVVALSSSISGVIMGSLIGWVYGRQQQILMELPVVSALPPLSVIIAIIVVSAILGPVAAKFGIRALVRRKPADVLRNP